MTLAIPGAIDTQRAWGRGAQGAGRGARGAGRGARALGAGRGARSREGAAGVVA